MNIEQMLLFDREHIWHPYTSPTSPLPVIPVVSASGVRLTLANGRQLIDGMASWWCLIHGYNHPVLNRAITGQLEKMSHVMFGGITHPQAVTLAQKLIDLTPDNLQKVFFCDSGSIAVEVAIKMAIQYWHALKHPEKKRLLTIRHGYHGDSFGAMSVCDPVSGMHHIFSGVVANQLFADSPKSKNDDQWDPSDLESFKELINNNHRNLAAVILEPIVQGAGGMRFYAPEFLRQVKILCDQYDVLLILDEIATGFGRTGRLFACEHAQLSPDILCLGKAITGGYMSFAATLTTARIGEVIGRDNGVFMHGPTFMANPLACAVANASIDLLLESDWQANINRIAAIMKQGLYPARDLPGVNDVRVLGGIGVVEMKEPVDMARMQPQFVERGVWLRPFDRLIYMMPPYIINDDDLKFLIRQALEVIRI